MKSICSICQNNTNQKVLFEEKVDLDEREEGWWEITKYQIIRCEGCDNISFRKLYNNAQQNFYSDQRDPWTQEVYPKRSLTSLQIKTLLNTPANIIKIYRETIDAFNNDQLILCSVGIRAIIEGVCNDKGIIGGNCADSKGKKYFSQNLNGKIEGLAAQGYLTKTNSEMLHELRFLGNAAVHELTSPSTEDLGLAIEIVEHSIEVIYEIQHKAKRLKNKRTGENGN
jgi:hypothetical protein